MVYGTQSLFNESLKIAVKANELDFVRRIGQKNTENEALVVGLTTIRKKILILKNINKLIGTKIGIKEDFPIEISYQS